MKILFAALTLSVSSLAFAAAPTQIGKGFGEAAERASREGEDWAGDFQFFFFDAQADSALEELKAQIHPGNPWREADYQVIREFERMEKDLEARSLVLAKNKQKKGIYLKYDPSQVGPVLLNPPRTFLPVDRLPMNYRHHLEFELVNERGQKGEENAHCTLKPNAVLSGVVVLDCEGKFKQCQVVGVNFRQAGVRWEYSRCPRHGAESSAGGASQR